METLVFWNERMLRHDPGPGGVETASRLQPLLAELAARPVPGTRVLRSKHAAAADLLRVHDAAHVERIAATAGGPPQRLDWDTVAGADSYDCALLAAGAAVAATRAVVLGRSQGAWALVRPPGHHAERDRPMGFCLFNNVAAAAAHAIAELGVARVLILDMDVHHGNGTQQIFWERSDVLYVSTHQHPLYPGTGSGKEIGGGPGRGCTLNLPLPAGSGDAAYLRTYLEQVEPAVQHFQPELILVSAGFDIWQNDPLGGMKVTAEGFSALAGLFLGWAEQFCPRRLAWVLEGGYDPAGVALGFRVTLEVTAGARAPVAAEKLLG